ncbi:hypothetical protein [Moraxella lacunata]|uniref:hypothetical protein n=1 Tax=Moraxella lacunata TaxID=477 RepID=UPI003EE2141D
MMLSGNATTLGRRTAWVWLVLKILATVITIPLMIVYILDIYIIKFPAYFVKMIFARL